MITKILTVKVNEVLKELGVVQPPLHHPRDLALGHSLVGQVSDRFPDTQQF
jgi:hypothetical protein